MCMYKVAHEVSIGITKGEIYNLLDVWERYIRLLSKLILADSGSTGHGLTISCKGCSRENRVSATARTHEPQLLFHVVPAKVVVQTLNETKDEQEDVGSGQGWHKQMKMPMAPPEGHP